MSKRSPRRRQHRATPTDARFDLARTVVRAVLPRPDLWWVAGQTVRRLAPAHWWARWPFLPLPDARYWDFRLLTAFGTGGGHAPWESGSPVGDHAPGLSGDDVVDFLGWCRRMPAPDR